MYQESTQAVIIDNGSGYMKAGISGDDAPRSTFPTVVGRPKYENIMVGMNNKQAYVGEEAVAKNGVLKLNYPIQHGIINNWDDLRHIWHHCFYNQLRVTPSEHAALVTEPPKNPKANRQKTTELFFEIFETPRFYLAKQAPLALHTHGKTTGVVLDSGQGVTHAVPVQDGVVLEGAVERNNLAGRDLTDYMRKLLNQLGLNFSASADTETIRDIKQKLCYVALDYEQQVPKYQTASLNTSYELPDGQTVILGNQKFRCPEALFRPGTIGKEMLGVHQLIHQAVLKSDAGIRKQLYENIVLCGGSTLFQGISERVSKEIVGLVPAENKVKVYAPAERKFSVWIGGSMLSTLSTFKDQWITKMDYQEYGTNIVHKKCP